MWGINLACLTWWQPLFLHSWTPSWCEPNWLVIKFWIFLKYSVLFHNVGSCICVFFTEKINVWIFSLNTGYVTLIYRVLYFSEIYLLSPMIGTVYLWWKYPYVYIDIYVCVFKLYYQQLLRKLAKYLAFRYSKISLIRAHQTTIYHLTTYYLQSSTNNLTKRSTKSIIPS